MSKELEMLRKWCDETLNWRNAHVADLRAILRRLEAAERVCEKAGFIPCEMLARFFDNEDAKGRWPSSGHDNQAQRDLRSLDAALRAYRALDGEETQ